MSPDKSGHILPPMRATTHFNLRRLIRDHIEENPDQSPHVVATEVLASIPDEHLREALAAALGPFVVAYVGSQRQASLRSLSSSPPRPTTGPPATTGPRRGRRHEAHAFYARLLADKVYVGDTWKSLGECSKDDLKRLADDRDRRAGELADMAKRYRRLAQVMASGQFVADLSEAVLREAFS